MSEPRRNLLTREGLLDRLEELKKEAAEVREQHTDAASELAKVNDRLAVALEAGDFGLGMGLNYHRQRREDREDKLRLVAKLKALEAKLASIEAEQESTILELDSLASSGTGLLSGFRQTWDYVSNVASSVLKSASLFATTGHNDMGETPEAQDE